MHGCRALGILRLADRSEYRSDPGTDLGSEQDVEIVAARLYAALRDLDAAQVNVILARDLSHDDGLWRAVRDRIHRAAVRVTVIGRAPGTRPQRGEPASNPARNASEG